MKIFDIDFKKLSQLLLPTFLRKKAMLALLTVILVPIQFIYDKFYSFRLQVLYELEINGQVCRLQKALNDKFDFNLRRIRISDAVWVEKLFIFLDSENKPLFLDGSTFLYQAAEIASKHVDFVVLIPSEITQHEITIKAIVDAYKLPTKTYELKTA